MRWALTALVLMALLLGCSALAPPGGLPAVPYHTLPGDPAGLLRLADRVVQRSRDIKALIRARTALKKADYLHPGQYQTRWRLARVDGLLARLDPSRARSWAAECADAGASAQKLAPKRVEGHLYQGICLGFVVQSSPARADELSQAIIAALSAANTIDPTYQHGEARRVLGALYIYAPPWPAGVGDLDEAIDTLEQLHKEFPNDPLNTYFLAEAYRRADQPEDAYRLFKRVRRAPPRGRWRLEGRPFRAKAKAFMRALRKHR